MKKENEIVIKFFFLKMNLDGSVKIRYQQTTISKLLADRALPMVVFVVAFAGVP